MNELMIQDTEKRAELIRVMESSLYPGAQHASIELALGYCAAAGLDPLQKPVHIVPMWDNKAGKMRDVIMPGIALYRTQASRTGQHLGTSEPEFGPMVSERLSGADVTFPEWCRVTVRRMLPGGAVAEFSSVEYWMENYAAKGGKEKSIAPNAMWARRVRGQIAKCAEAQALRKAFPELCSLPTAEEMEGKHLGDEMPQAAPAPRHMGDLKRVDAAPAECPEALRILAEEAALSGVEAYREFFGCLSRDDRRVLAPLHDAMKQAAAEADADRVATAPAPAGQTDAEFVAGLE
jgi:phage recombination protein Bet